MPDTSEQLAAQAAELLPADCSLGWADPARRYPLLPGEIDAGMVPRRAAEFSAGRFAARQAMLLAGQSPVALPQGADRAPVWPAGLVGSISHSDRACIAAVSTARAGLGLDIEPNVTLPDELAVIIRCEGDRVSGWQGRADPALLLFCAKEAAFKAQYPLSRQILGPEMLRIALQGETLQAVFQADVAPFAAGDGIGGRITLCAGHVLALAWLE